MQCLLLLLASGQQEQCTLHNQLTLTMMIMLIMTRTILSNKMLMMLMVVTMIMTMARMSLVVVVSFGRRVSRRYRPLLSQAQVDPLCNVHCVINYGRQR